MNTICRFKVSNKNGYKIFKLLDLLQFFPAPTCFTVVNKTKLKFFKFYNNLLIVRLKQ